MTPMNPTTPITDIASIRSEYTRAGLHERDVSRDPFAQFDRWFHEAVTAGVAEVNACTLATATPDGQPDARIVLLKGYDARGFVFFTNYESHKGAALHANPRAALVFFWHELERQVRIRGTVSKIAREESDAYFHSRPRGSQLGAWASRQSAIIAGREVIEGELAEITARFGDGPIPLPPFWGGYRVEPSSIELWQGRPSRLHDRLQYTRNTIDPAAAWALARLSP